MSDRFQRISELLSDREARAAYIWAKLGVLVPAQIRALRLKSEDPPMPRQKDLSHESGIHQSRISTFETPGAANITLETLAKIAAGLKVGVIVKFVPFTEMWQWDNGFVPATFNVRPRLDRDDTFLDPEYRLYNPQTGKLSGFRAKVDNRLVEKKEDLGQQKISAKSVHEDADEEMNAMGTAAGY